MLNLQNPEVLCAIEAVRKAARLAQKVRSGLNVSSLTKTDKSPVTVADFGVQAIISSALSKQFPHDPLVAEEDSASFAGAEGETVLSQVTAFVREILPEADRQKVHDWIERGIAVTAGRFWTLDPIDGTKGFLRGDQYAIALALIVDGQVQLGVLGCPNLVDASELQIGGAGSLVVAQRGAGAWFSPLNAANGEFKPLRVSGVTDISEATFLRSFETGHTNTSQTDRLREILAVKAQPLLMDSMAKYAVLAAGKGDLFFRLLSSKQPNYRECIWDQAAGALVVEEAGGKITDLNGKALDFTTGRRLTNNRGIIASNGILHVRALEAVRAVCQLS